MMKQSVHPGSIVKDDCIEALGLSVTKAASALGVSRPTLSKVISGQAAISPEMAIRLAKAFGSRPETWLRMQLAFDLSQLPRLTSRINVKRIRQSKPRRGGQLRGKLSIADDFDVPVPELERLFNGDKP